jgi:uroporphyrinogen-III synthase
MKPVLVTRPAGEDDPLVAELEARGYAVRAVPTVATRPLAVEWPDFDAYDWIVLTSATGVATLPDVGSAGRWAAVGEATAAALRARGVEVAAVPAVANGLALAETIPDAAGARVLLVRGALAAADLPTGLRARGATVDEVVAYETVEGPEASRPKLAGLDAAAVVFASGSAVRGYLTLGGRSDVPAVTIGPRTSAVARDAGFTVVAEASARSAAELAAAVEAAIPMEVAPDA